MKLTFMVGLAVALAALAVAIRSGIAAEPVDVFVTPVPTKPGTSSAILPPGTYHAVRQDGVKLSGLIHSSDISKFPALSRSQPSPSIKTHILQHNPGLKFVPVDPRPRGKTQMRPSR